MQESVDSKMQDSVFVTLSEPVEYGEGGETKETDQIEIRCPSFIATLDRRYYDHLKSMLASIMMEMAGNATDGQGDGQDAEESAGIEPNMMTYVLLSKLGDKFTDEVMAFEKHAPLFCRLDDTTPLDDGPLKRIHPDDKGLLFGTFMANFILPSLLRLMNGNNSLPISSTPIEAA